MRIRKTADEHVPDQEQEGPSSTRRAMLTGGAIGLAAVAGASFGGAAPADAATVDITQITPTGDTTGVEDTTAIQDAINVFVTAGTGGTIYLGPGEFYITYVPDVSTLDDIAIDLPAQVVSGDQHGYGVNIQGCGSATVVFVVGNYTGIYCHRTSDYASQYGWPAQHTTSFLRDFVVDGTNAGADSVGVDIGDGWGYDLNLVIVNFIGASAIGLQIINRLLYTEKGRFRAQLMNNTTAAALTWADSGDISHEYNFYDFNIFCQEDQQGVVVSEGINNGGCILWLHGNMSSTSAGVGDPPTGNVAALTLTGTDGSGDYSQFYNSEIILRVEGNPGNGAGNVSPYAIYFGSGDNSIQQCFGMIAHSLTPSDLNGGEFSFRGFVPGDAGLSLIYPGGPGTGSTISTQPPLPSPSGTAQQNYGPDAMVSVMGSDVTSVTVSSINTGQASGGFFVPAGGVISVAYTGGTGTNASWKWIPAAHSPY
ncbi:MAG: hypothetical protein ACRDNF_04530 [Streptosporangiaceae bacterium]